MNVKKRPTHHLNPYIHIKFHGYLSRWKGVLIEVLTPISELTQPKRCDMISFEKKPEVKNNSNSQKPADKKVATKAKEQAEKPSELSLADNDEKKPTVKG